MVVLGIDPGIADTGWGVVVDDGSRLKSLGYGSIKTSSQRPMNERLTKLHDELGELIKVYKPDLVAIEQLFFCKNVKTALVVGQARGVILLTCQLAKTTTREFTPLQVKQAVAAYGGADKKQVQNMVKMLLGLVEIPQPDDAADALAIAVCALNSAKVSSLTEDN